MERTASTAEHPLFNPETFARQWPHLREQLKTWWDQLTETDLERIAGQKDQLIRVVQEKYGYAWERAEQEVNRRLQEYRDAMGTSAQDLASNLAETAGKVTATVQDMARTVADTVTGSGPYLQELPREVLGLIRRYPVPALLVGVGLGFLLARSLRKD